MMIISSPFAYFSWRGQDSSPYKCCTDEKPSDENHVAIFMKQTFLQSADRNNFSVRTTAGHARYKDQLANGVYERHHLHSVNQKKSIYKLGGSNVGLLDLEQLHVSGRG
jgi:hypothetical protein